MKFLSIPAWMLILLALSTVQATAQPGGKTPATLEEISRSLVHLRAEIPASARTAKFLGQRREGNGVVIGDKGLILTIGYLILEANRIEVVTHQGKTFPARVVGYDPNSGFGLLSANVPLGVPALALGDSNRLAVKDPALVITAGKEDPIGAVQVVSVRTFAGYWEYLLEGAIFVSPPRRNYAGAALVDKTFHLVGIGSLFVQDSLRKGGKLPGNMFVPINRIKPVLSALIRTGGPGTPPKPWLGVNVAEQFGRLIVTRVSRDGPASASGLAAGDIILEIAGKKVDTLERFFRELWRQGKPGVSVRLKVLQGNTVKSVSVKSRDRSLHYRGKTWN
ncbi:MAG: S1C family serine protease [bacterium]